MSLTAEPAAVAPGPPLQVAIVVPRYGPDTHGGAELLCRDLAWRLAEAGHRVEVLTTCAADHFTWRNQLPPGRSQDGPVVVRRFPVDDRDLGVHGELERAIVGGYPLSREEERLWMRHGVASLALEDHLADHLDTLDVVVAAPYLFGTTYFAYEVAAPKLAVVPCLHDEAYARLAIVGDMLRGSRGVLFNAWAEADFARSLVGEIERWTMVGMGFEPDPVGDAAAFRRRHRLGNGPLLLSVGRREGGKNVPLLIEHFCRYKHRRGGDLVLVQAGSGDVALPRRPDVVDLKPDWRHRDAMYRAATVFCQPSVNESLSIVMMQAWLAERPVLVHGRAAVTRDHCERSGGGLWFSNYAEFEAVLDRLLADAALRDALGRGGRAYVRSEYSPGAVLERFHAAAYSWLADTRVTAPVTSRVTAPAVT
ncbi:MAG: glycosyltransferase family 4 protein [Actinomycetota bacterium]